MREGNVWINAPHFCAGMTIVRGVCTWPAAPILRWAIGKRWRDLEPYLQRKGWQYELWESLCARGPARA